MKQSLTGNEGLKSLKARTGSCRPIEDFAFHCIKIGHTSDPDFLKIIKNGIAVFCSSPDLGCNFPPGCNDDYYKNRYHFKGHKIVSSKYA